MLSLCILPSAENALVMSLIFLIWKLNLQTKLWNNSLCRTDHHPFFNNKSVLCPHLQLISFVLQHSGNLFSRPQPTDGFFPGACLSTFCPRTKPIPVHKHVQALVCLAYPKAMYHLDPLLSFGWLSTFPLPWSWSHRCCSGLTKVGSVGHHYLIVFLVCCKDWTSVFVSDASCGKFSIPYVLSFPFFLPAFALMCLLCYWRTQTFLLFLCGHLLFSISNRHNGWL